MPDKQTQDIMVLQQIREAIGDNGKLMQDELVEHIKQLVDLANTVAHVGVDFGYGEFELESQHVEQARRLVPLK